MSKPKKANRVVREQAAAEQRRTRVMWISGIAILLLVAAGIVGWSVTQSQKPAAYATPAGVNSVGGTDAGIDVAGQGPVTVEVYLDFLCPACKQFETTTTDTVNQLIAQNKIRLIWHPLSFLDSRTNPAGYSGRSASAAGCAADGGKLSQYGQTLFANQPPEGSAGLTDDQLIDLGGPLGLNAPSFAQCVRGAKYHDWVSNVDDKAAQRGINATPTVFVNGQVLTDNSPQGLAAAVAAAS